jgi:hypothetical protein
VNATRKVLVGVLVGGSIGFFAGCVLGVGAGRRAPCAECRQWKAQCDDYEAEIAKADRTIADLLDQIPTVFMAGQVFQAERKDADL